MDIFEEEEKLVEMVHDFIESRAPTPASNSSSKIISLHQSTCLVLQGILGSATNYETEASERVRKYVGEMGNEMSSSMKKRLVMMLRKEGYDASPCKSSWVATLGCPGGDYEYIDIVMKGTSGASIRLIVDVDFRSQFELARPTPAYSELFNTLPTIFVGNEEHLSQIISLLCSAAKQSLRERGLHIPPWRKPNYMQSKWFTCCERVSTIPFPISNTQDGSDSETNRANSWTPSNAKPKRRDSRSESRSSCLSSQLSSLSINCC